MKYAALRQLRQACHKSGDRAISKTVWKKKQNVTTLGVQMLTLIKRNLICYFGVGAPNGTQKKATFWMNGNEFMGKMLISQKEKWAKETVWQSKHTDWKSCGFGVTKGWNRNLTEITRVFFGGKGRGRLDEFRLMAASMAIISCSYIFLILQHSTRMKWGRVLFITQFRIYYSSKRDTAFRQTRKSTTTKSSEQHYTKVML